MTEVPLNPSHDRARTEKSLLDCTSEIFSWHYVFPVLSAEACERLANIFDAAPRMSDELFLDCIPYSVDKTISDAVTETVNVLLRKIMGDDKVRVEESNTPVIRKNYASCMTAEDSSKGGFVVQIRLCTDCEGANYFVRRYGEASTRVERLSQGYAVLRPSALPYVLSPVTHGDFYDLFFYYDYV